MELTFSDTSETSSFDHKSRNRIVLPKSCVLQAIETILEPRKSEPVGRRAKINATYKADRASMFVDWLCTDKTHLPIYCSRSSCKTMKENSLKPVLNEMRLCLLAGDWDGYKELLSVSLKSPNIESDYILFSVRSCFVLLLNHPHRTAEMIDNFITSCLSINEESRRKSYLQECFSFRVKSACTENKDIVHKETEEEEKEEEIFFNSDFSSD